MKFEKWVEITRDDGSKRLVCKDPQTYYDDEPFTKEDNIQFIIALVGFAIIWTIISTIISTIINIIR